MTAADPTAAATDTTTSQPASAAGGEKAQTGAGKATESANDASKTSDQANQAAGADAGASGSRGAAGATSGVAGLDTVPLTFTFTGSYFDLADFFHRVKRFVRVANEDIRVKGRLMTIDTMAFSSDKPPTVKATVTASVYLAPKSEGATGGGNVAGPEHGDPGGGASGILVQLQLGSTRPPAPRRRARSERDGREPRRRTCASGGCCPWPCCCSLRLAGAAVPRR